MKASVDLVPLWLYFSLLSQYSFCFKNPSLLELFLICQGFYCPEDLYKLFVLAGTLFPCSLPLPRFPFYVSPLFIPSVTTLYIKRSYLCVTTFPLGIFPQHLKLSDIKQSCHILILIAYYVLMC